MDTASLVAVSAELLGAMADPERAERMAAYMKTDMPFYGVKAQGVKASMIQVAKAFPPADHGEYEAAVLALWRLPHREEKHMAIGYARRFRRFVDSTSFDLYRLLVVEGAWWDFVDEIAAHLIGKVLLDERQTVSPIIESWITDPDMWLRRTSIICQLSHKADTDTELLAAACVANMADTEFFIRKAIGWALREYAKSDPEWVRAFVDQHRNEMSGLSIREATKHLG